MELSLHLIALLTSVAFVAGFIDAMAGGGGLLTVPALLSAGLPPALAIGTNKLQSSTGTCSAFIAFARKGQIDFRRFVAPALGAVVGGAMGALTLQVLDPGFLAGVIPLLLVAMAGYFLLAPRMSEADRHGRLGPRGLVPFALAIGFYDGFFGPGTGSFFTTVLVTLGGMGLVRAIAHAKFLNFLTNIGSLVAMVLGGKVLWALGLAMAVGSIAGNQLGAHAAMRFKGRGVRVLLVVMSLALTVKLLSDPANPLHRLLSG